MLLRLWGWWTNSWRRPRLARRLYLVMGAAFAALAIAAALLGDVAVAVLAGVFAVLGAPLAIVMPKLAARREAGRGQGDRAI